MKSRGLRLVLARITIARNRTRSKFAGHGLFKQYTPLKLTFSFEKWTIVYWTRYSHKHDKHHTAFDICHKFIKPIF